MPLWLLIFSALGLGAWGDFPQISWNETQARDWSEELLDLFASISSFIRKNHSDVPAIVSRKAWGARPLTCTAQLSLPVVYILTEQLTGLECREEDTCRQRLRDLQSHSVHTQGQCDVAYNFLVGDDGRVYEGVGWNVQGLHTQGYNNVSLGIAFFGNVIGSDPSPAALSAAEGLIFHAMQKGHLSPRYIQPLLLKACPNIITRSAWEARETHCPKMNLPARYVIIIHTAGMSCNVSMDCQTRVRDTQSFHMDTQSFCDIGYHFLVGPDGGVYEGVGWHVQGSHTYGYNDIALGIAFIGNFVVTMATNNFESHHLLLCNMVVNPEVLRVLWECLLRAEKPPNAAALEAAQTLIECAVSEGHLRPSYLLLGHSDVSRTLSPGQALYNIIRTWPHFKH